MGTYRISVVVEKDKEGYYASCPDSQGCYTQGDTFEELIENMKGAVESQIDDLIFDINLKYDCFIRACARITWQN